MKASQHMLKIKVSEFYLYDLQTCNVNSKFKLLGTKNRNPNTISFLFCYKTVSERNCISSQHLQQSKQRCIQNYPQKEHSPFHYGKTRFKIVRKQKLKDQITAERILLPNHTTSYLVTTNYNLTPLFVL